MLKNFQNQLSNFYLNQSSHLFLSSLRQHFESQQQNVLSLSEEPVSKVILRQTNQVMAEFLHFKLLIRPFSFQSQSTIFCSFVFQIYLCVWLSKVKQCQSVTFLNLLKVVPALVVKAELPPIALVWSVVACVHSRPLSTSLIHFIGFAQTPDSPIKIFPVDKTQSEHVVANDKVLVKFWNFLWGKFGQFEKRLCITFHWVMCLLNIRVQLTQDWVWNEGVWMIFVLN